jgi:hypothetical protein
VAHHPAHSRQAARRALIYMQNSPLALIPPAQAAIILISTLG